MAYADGHTMKLNGNGIMMERLIYDELDTLIMILIEMYDSADIEV